MNDKPSIGILGPGAVGGFLAAMFWQAGFPVTCVARESTTALIQKEGILVNSVDFGTIVAHPEATACLDAPVDILFVTTKGQHLSEALKRISQNALQSGMVVPLLNGYEHMNTLRKVFGPRLVGGVVRIEAKYVAPNRFDHTSHFALIQWASQDFPMADLKALANQLQVSRVDFETYADENQVLFDKLVRLNALALTTSAFNCELGVIRNTPEYRNALEGCVREGVTVAKAMGLAFETAEVLAFIDKLPATLGTSMQRDLYSGKTTEVDAIGGALMRLGEHLQIPCHTIATLVERIRSIEEAQYTIHHSERSLLACPPN